MRPKPLSNWEPPDELLLTGDATNMRGRVPEAWECIDCGLCAPECPKAAIFYDDRVPIQWQGDIELNRQMSRCCPNITSRNAIGR